MPEKGVNRVVEYLEVAKKTFRHKASHWVFEDCALKLEAGEEKYGSPLEIFNGRDADLDAYQDTLDSINYQIQGLMESTSGVENLSRAIDITNTLKIADNMRKRLVKKGILDG